MPLRFLILLLLSAISLNAQSIVASFEPNPISPGNVGNLTVTVTNMQLSQLDNPQLPPELQLAGGAQQSNQMSINGNQQTSITTISWPVTAMSEGTFQLPGINYFANGQPGTTAPITVVVKAGAQPAPPSGLGGQRGGAPSIEPLLQLTPAKTEFYVGEMVPVTAAVYIPRRVGLQNIGLIEVEKTDLAIQRFPKNFEQGMVNLEGDQYHQLSFRSVFSALRPGKLKLGPAKAEATLEVPVRGGFMAMFGEPRKFELKAAPVSINVLPLPTEGKPQRFSGAVGQFSFRAHCDSTSARVGEPIPVDLSIEGIGNFDAISSPELTDSAGWRTYPPRRYSVDGDDPNLVNLANRKIGFNVMLVPEKPVPEIPAFEFSFFNPDTKQYVNLRSQPMPVTITGSAMPEPEATGVAATATNAPGAKAPEADITGILTALPTSPRLASVAVPLSRDFPVLAIHALGLLTLLGWLSRVLLDAQRSRSANNPEVARRSLWATLAEAGISEGEFYRRAAHYLTQIGQQGSKAAVPVMQRYESSRFTGAAAAESAISKTDREAALDHISTLRAAPGSPLMKGLLCAALFLCTSMAMADSAIYEQAKTALEKGDFVKAQQLGEAAVKAGSISPDSFSLIGHALYQQRKPGLAAIWYQRAWLFPGASPELRQNLRHVSEKLKFLRPDWTSSLTTWAMTLSKHSWVLMGSLAFWLTLYALIYLIRGARGSKLLALLTALLLGLSGTIAGATGYLARPSAADVADKRFIIAEKVQAHSAASSTSGSVIELPTGSMVRHLDERGAWTYIEIFGEPGQNDSITEVLRGWVKTDQLEPVWPYATELVP
jgi:hypothetical protein